jgi:hypothetical protein
MPSPDCDLLTGRDQIAAWFGLTCGRCDARIHDSRIITFKEPGNATVYALKSVNIRRWREAAEAHRNGQLG